MTIEQKMRELLFNNGMFDTDVDTVMGHVKAAPETAAVRWSDQVGAAGSYPPAFVNALWLTVSRHALEWIDESCPQAWFRSLFVPETQATASSEASASP